VPGKDKLEAIIHDPRAKNKTEAFGAVARASFKLVEPTQGWGGARCVKLVEPTQGWGGARWC